MAAQSGGIIGNGHCLVHTDLTAADQLRQGIVQQLHTLPLAGLHGADDLEALVLADLVRSGQVRMDEAMAVANDPAALRNQFGRY